MSAGQIAALVAAGAFVLLVLFLVIALVKLGRTLDEATVAIRKAHENTDPLLHGASDTITHVNTQLERVDGITSDVRTVSGNASALSSVFTATLGGPLVKTAALSYGMSKAIKARRAAKAENGKHTLRRGRKSKR
ncbi:protein of unknown function (DUF948) [Prauserella aidingensis]|uniref:DUF948 domain-containing protein n=1 Tax=Prauserella isguenensis TaxID=1470180 RepID=A0A839S976_9PSEU|nr:DUF948 domain-containing protein [Prauserella aidingensis]MBB3053239.1 hypothetical protein [Prauserella isguenensis]MCP2253956.1 protein of unknown function (DUF948) [Prauserella aidingensis]